MNFKSAVLAIGLLALPTLGHAANYEIDPVHSSAQFAVKHLMVSTVRGEFTKLSGTAVIDDKTWASRPSKRPLMQPRSAREKPSATNTCAARISLIRRSFHRSPSSPRK